MLFNYKKMLCDNMSVMYKCLNECLYTITVPFRGSKALMKRGSPRNTLANILGPKAKTEMYMAAVCVNMFLTHFLNLYDTK